MKIGYIGLGAMGNALARRLVSQHSVVVWDLNPKAVAALVDIGAAAAPDVKRLGDDCEIVFLCLPRSSDVESVIFRAGGLAEGLRPGALIIDQTSGVPWQTHGFAQKLARLGIGMVDAPVAGGVPQALAGSVTIMVSGGHDELSRALPVLETLSPRIFRCSDRVGDAQAAKLVNNCINSGYRMATLELVALGSKLGLTLPVMTDALLSGWGSNFTAKRLLTSLVERKPSTNFALSLMLKDVNQCLAIAMKHGAPMPISSIARGLMQVGLNLLRPDAGLDEIVPAIERLSAAKFLDPDSRPAGEVTVPPACAGQGIGVVGIERLSEGAVAALKLHPVTVVDVLDDMESVGPPAVIIDFTRRSLSEWEARAAKLAAKGVELLDVVTADAPGAAIDAPATWLCGGSRLAFAEAKPILEAVSGTAIHCGPLGSSRSVELIVGALAVCNRAIVCENALAGLKFGLEPAAMAVVLNEGSGWSYEGDLVLQALGSGHPTTTVTLAMALEFLRELAGLAVEKGAPLFIANVVRTMIEAEAMRSGPNATLDALGRA